MNSEFANNTWDDQLINKTPDEKLGIILSVIEEIVIKYVPLKTSIRRNRPKIPRDPSILMKKRRRLQTQMNLKISNIQKAGYKTNLSKSKWLFKNLTLLPTRTGRPKQ